jgi:hypothetical protein
VYVERSSLDTDTFPTSMALKRGMFPSYGENNDKGTVSRDI